MMSDVTETDLTTDPPTITVRDFTEGELAQRKNDAADAKANKKALDAEQAAKDAARVSAVAKLSALGLDALEVQAIIGTL
jgi:hypothetical protein